MPLQFIEPDCWHEFLLAATEANERTPHAADCFLLGSAFIVSDWLLLETVGSSGKTPLILTESSMC